MAKDKTYVRRGFDIEIGLYNKFRERAAKLGVFTKDYINLTLQNQLKNKTGEDKISRRVKNNG